MAKNKDRGNYRGFRDFYENYDEEFPKKKRMDKKGRTKTKIREKLDQIDLNNINDEDFDDLDDYV